MATVHALFVSSSMNNSHAFEKTMGASPEIIFTSELDFFIIFFILANGKECGPVFPPASIPEKAPACLILFFLLLLYSSLLASWYCWYSATKSFMLLSASVNSISSIPSPVYQCKKAFLRNMAVNCSLTLLNISWMDVELPMNVEAIFRPIGGMSHTVDFTLFGIHSTKYDEFLF
nr:protein TUB21 [Ipomoea batatas]GME20962.1 protein TUB21 [Ipomoea batatas]